MSIHHAVGGVKYAVGFMYFARLTLGMCSCFVVAFRIAYRVNGTRRASLRYYNVIINYALLLYIVGRQIGIRLAPVAAAAAAAAVVANVTEYL